MASDCGLEGLTFQEPSLVQPQFADDCDLSLIVKRFLRTGELPADSRVPSEISDTSGLPADFQSLMDGNTRIIQQFDMLPLEERNKFNNDPVAWAESLLQQQPQPQPTNVEPQPQPQPTNVEPQLQPQPTT